MRSTHVLYSARETALADVCRWFQGSSCLTIHQAQTLACHLYRPACSSASQTSSSDACASSLLACLLERLTGEYLEVSLPGRLAIRWQCIEFGKLYPGVVDQRLNCSPC